MNPRRNIVILTLRVAAGHGRMAEVIQRSIQDGGENLEILTLDALELGVSWFRRRYAGTFTGFWRLALGKGRRLFGSRRRESSLRLPDWLLRRGCREVLRRLRGSAPHLVIATETGAAEIAALGKRDGWFTGTLLAVQSELPMDPAWVQWEVDVYAVASEEARAQLIAWGVSPNRVVLCGFPIDPAFSLPFDEAEVLQALGLDAKRPVVLVMGGGFDREPLDEAVLWLERCALPLQVVAVCGHDRALKTRLDARRGRIALDLHVFGWTDMVPELMTAADLLVTSPGGHTTAEALTVGLPMVLTPSGPDVRGKYARHLEGAGAAVRARSLAEIPELVERMLDDSERLAGMSKRAQELSRPDAAHAVAQIARALLETASYIDFLAAPPTRSGESAYLM